MTAEESSRKPGVIAAMDLIRPLFGGVGRDVMPYTNDEIAEALLRTCPERSDFWLSQEHLFLTFQALSMGSLHR